MASPIFVDAPTIEQTNVNSPMIPFYIGDQLVRLSCVDVSLLSFSDTHDKSFVSFNLAAAS